MTTMEWDTESFAKIAAAGAEKSGMVKIPGRTFRMGSDHHYPEEGPAHLVRVQAFWMDKHPVTNAHFQEFVDATGYVTIAEKTPDSANYPDGLPELMHAGSLVFMPPPGPIGECDWSQWWRYRKGADWRHPSGPGSSICGLEDHPVVHVAYDDALAYARWAAKDLPTEAEWELACRGGLDDAEYAWGSELAPEGRMMANYWQGQFPFQNLKLDGYEGTSPVSAFPANGYGLFDMIGNVWEWTSDTYAPRHGKGAQSCCGSSEPKTKGKFGQKVLKGGSHLCAANYCMRYRPAARSPQTTDTSSCHIGFRCVIRDRQT